MKLAFITSLALTERPDTGFEIANAAIVEALRADGHAVTIFAFARTTDVLRPDPDLVLLDRIVIENHIASAPRKLGWLAAALAGAMPFASAKLRLAGRGKLLERLNQHGPFDALVLNSVMMPGAFPELTRLAPFGLVAHNIEHVSAAQNAAHAKGAAMRWLFRREARLLEALERKLASECSFVWCLAEDDRLVLASLAGPAIAAKSAVLPLVSTSMGRRMASIQPPTFDVGLIGTWTWEPNLIGLKWFLSEVLPLLPKSLRVAVAGRTPADLAAPPGVSFVGRVPDAAEFLGDCAVVALASKAGTGVQLKTIEALQIGLPAVATNLSMRGLGSPPANVRLAEGADAFAAALIEHVEGTRTGTVTRLDGRVFMQAQAAALSDAIKVGINRLKSA